MTLKCKHCNGKMQIVVDVYDEPQQLCDTYVTKNMKCRCASAQDIKDYGMLCYCMMIDTDNKLRCDKCNIDDARYAMSVLGHFHSKKSEINTSLVCNKCRLKLHGYDNTIIICWYELKPRPPGDPWGNY